MTFKRFCLLSLSVALTFSVTGCAWFNVGEEEFACTGMPGSVYCHSARDVYNATNDGSVPSRMGPNDGYNAECEDCERSEGDKFNAGYEGSNLVSSDGTAVTTGEGQTNRTSSSSAQSFPVANAKSVNGTGDEVINSYVSPKLPEHPVPVRTPAVVMRIWIAPWVDEADNLNSPGYVYTEIEPRRWIYKGANDGHMNMTFQPLLMTSMVTGDTKKEGFSSVDKLEEKNKAKQRLQ